MYGRRRVGKTFLIDETLSGKLAFRHTGLSPIESEQKSITDADKTVFVVRAGLLEREMLPMIDRYYDEQKLPNMAVLLNGTEKFNGHYGYHYGYYHHYGNYYREV